MASGRLDVVLVKLGAVIILVSSLPNIADLLSYLSGQEAYGSPLLVFGFSFVIPVLIAAVLWFFPATLIGRPSLDTEMDSERETANAGQLVLVGVTLVGLYAVVFGVIDLLYYESIRVAAADYLDSGSLSTYRPSPETVAGRYANIAQFIIGVLLLLGRRRLSRVLSNIRNG